MELSSFTKHFILENAQGPELLNTRAVAVVNRVSNKLTGRDFNPRVTLDVPTQVDRLILQATSLENLCQCYVGWYVKTILYLTRTNTFIGVPFGSLPRFLSIRIIIIFFFLSLSNKSLLHKNNYVFVYMPSNCLEITSGIHVRIKNLTKREATHYVYQITDTVHRLGLDAHLFYLFYIFKIKNSYRS